MSDIIIHEPQNISYSRDILHCHPYLQERWPKLLELFRRETGHDLVLTCTWRSVVEQQRLYRQGRGAEGPIVTNVDGVTKKSKHNLFPARSFDLAVDVDPSEVKRKVTWEPEKYEPLVTLCPKLGLISGGSWTHFKDYPHVEMPDDVA